MCGSEAIRIVGLDFKAGLLLASTFRDLPSLDSRAEDEVKELCTYISIRLQIGNEQEVSTESRIKKVKIIYRPVAIPNSIAINCRANHFDIKLVCILCCNRVIQPLWECRSMSHPYPKKKAKKGRLAGKLTKA